MNNTEHDTDERHRAYLRERLAVTCEELVKAANDARDSIGGAEDAATLRAAVTSAEALRERIVCKEAAR